MTLFTHQDDGAEFLRHRRKALLGDEAGLGKTRTVIAGLQRSRIYNPLVVCPAIVRTHWQREFQTMGFDGTPVVKSYDEIMRGGNALMKELVPETQQLVLDEIHYLKHATSQRTKQILGKDGYARRLNTWGASGTLMPRHPGELWTILVALFPELVLRYGFRDAEQWKDHFCVRKWVRGRGGIMREKVVGVKNAEQLREILAVVTLRRTLADVDVDVPDLFFQQLMLDGSKGPQIDAMFEAALREVSLYKGTITDLANVPHIARMRRLLGELKAGPVAELIHQTLDNGDEKLAVFAHHRSVLDFLRFALKDHGVAYVDGDVRQGARQAEIDRFQDDAECRVFLGQNIACQTGITLTAASRAILVEPDWTPDVNYQLGKRIARIGSTHDRCIAQLVTLAGTLDEAIVRQIRRETEMVAQVLK